MTVYRSLNDLIGPLQERLRDRQPERLRGLEIDHQLKLRGLFHREIGGLRPLEDFVGMGSQTLEHVAIVGSIRYEAADLDELPVLIDGGHSMSRRQAHDALALGVEEGGGERHDGSDTLARRRLERPLNVVSASGVESYRLESERTRRRLRRHRLGARRAGIEEHRNAGRLREGFPDELDPLRADLRV